MSGEKPYNPNNLTPEEQAAIDKAQAERLEKLLQERKAGKGVPEKIRLGTRFTKRPVRPETTETLLRAKGEAVKEEKTETHGKILFKEIKKMLKQYEFGGEFRITTSKKARGHYVFQLFPPSEKFRTEPELEFEESAEKITGRVKEYMDNTYAHKV